jgi:futalosine hydrolase
VLLIAATERELVGLAGAVCGIGPVDAAASTARELAQRRPAAVLHVGLAGRRGFEEPELVLGSEARYCDPDSPLVVSAARPDRRLLTLAQATLPDALVCPIGTSARVGGSSGCTVEAMEGFAVLRACELAGIPAVELRVTANEIDELDRARWRLDDGIALLERTLPRLVETLDA